MLDVINTSRGITKKVNKKLKVLKSCAFKDSQQPEFDQNFKKNIHISIHV